MASYLMPDVFAAVTILVAALLTLHRGNLSALEKIALALLSCLAITFHASHLLLACGLLVIAPVISRFLHDSWSQTAAILAWLGVPLLCAVVGILIVGIVGFKEVSVAPASPPFLLARVIEDGPGYRYIKEMCPRERFAVCAFSDDLPRTANEFLWLPEGVMTPASPEVRKQIREQEMEVVWAAVRAYPLDQAWASARAFVYQLGNFELWPFYWGHLDFSNPRDPRPPRPPSKEHGLFIAFSVIHYVVVIASVLVLVRVSVSQMRPLPREHVALVVFIGLGIIGNAAICGVLSGLAGRYQSRVIWLLPLLAAASVIARMSHFRWYTRGTS
jgi:hypothetical protein